MYIRPIRLALRRSPPIMSGSDPPRELLNADITDAGLLVNSVLEPQDSIIHQQPIGASR